MPLYTFYPRHEDGSSETFVSLDLDHDGLAARQALDMLELHPSAAYVEVWCEERRVLTRPRVHPDLDAVLRSDPSRA